MVSFRHCCTRHPMQSGARAVAMDCVDQRIRSPAIRVPPLSRRHEPMSLRAHTDIAQNGHVSGA